MNCYMDMNETCKSFAEHTMCMKRKIYSLKSICYTEKYFPISMLKTGILVLTVSHYFITTNVE